MVLHSEAAGALPWHIMPAATQLPDREKRIQNSSYFCNMQHYATYVWLLYLLLYLHLAHLPPTLNDAPMFMDRDDVHQVSALACSAPHVAGETYNSCSSSLSLSSEHMSSQMSQCCCGPGLGLAIPISTPQQCHVIKGILAVASHPTSNAIDASC